MRSYTGEAIKTPVGTAITLTRIKGGTWQGTIRIEVIGWEANANGLMGLIQKLARQALTEQKRVDTAAGQP